MSSIFWRNFKSRVCFFEIIVSHSISSSRNSLCIVDFLICSCYFVLYCISSSALFSSSFCYIVHSHSFYRVFYSHLYILEINYNATWISTQAFPFVPTTAAVQPPLPAAPQLPQVRVLLQMFVSVL